MPEYEILDWCALQSQEDRSLIIFLSLSIDSSVNYI
jgi:hypothetical protein